MACGKNNLTSDDVDRCGQLGCPWQSRKVTQADRAALERSDGLTSVEQPTLDLLRDREARLRDIARIIEAIDRLAMASDGPIPPTNEVATLQDFQNMWEICGKFLDGGAGEGVVNLDDTADALKAARDALYRIHELAEDIAVGERERFARIRQLCAPWIEPIPDPLFDLITQLDDGSTRVTVNHRDSKLGISNIIEPGEDPVAETDRLRDIMRRVLELGVIA